MAHPEDAARAKLTLNLSELQDARVHVTGEDRLRVEFRIDELVKKLIPGGALASSCGGCRGCTGCSH